MNTLVVIGIIAAITVPVIMTKHKKTEYSTKLKKFYSTMSNAIKLAEIEQGSPSYEWDYSEETDVFKNYLLKYLNCEQKNINVCALGNDEYFTDDSNFGDCYTQKACFFNDGVFFTYHTYENKNMEFSVILTGLNKRSTYGKDIYAFDIGRSINIYNLDNPDEMYNMICEGLQPRGVDPCIKDNNPLEICKGEQSYCTPVIFNNGFDFNNYPYRI